MKSLREFETLCDFTMTYDGLFEYNICDLLDYLDIYSMEWEKGCEVFKTFCEENSITYYAAPRETFSRQDGFDKARNENHRRVVMEDLS